MTARSDMTLIAEHAQGEGRAVVRQRAALPGPTIYDDTGEDRSRKAKPKQVRTLRDLADAPPYIGRLEDGTLVRVAWAAGEDVFARREHVARVTGWGELEVMKGAMPVTPEARR